MLLSAVSSSSSCPSSLCALQTSAARILSRPKGPLSPTSYCVFSNERQGPDGFPPVAAGFAMLTRLCSNLVVAANLDRVRRTEGRPHFCPEGIRMDDGGLVSLAPFRITIGPDSCRETHLHRTWAREGRYPRVWHHWQRHRGFFSASSVSPHFPSLIDGLQLCP